MMFITTYNRLKAAEQKRLFDTIFTNGSFANMLDMHLHLAGRSFAHGATCFVALEADQIRALAGVLTKHTTKWGELCIPLLEMVPANEIILRALLDQIVRSLSALGRIRLRSAFRRMRSSSVRYCANSVSTSPTARSNTDALCIRSTMSPLQAVAVIRHRQLGCNSSRCKFVNRNDSSALTIVLLPICHTCFRSIWKTPPRRKR